MPNKRVSPVPRANGAEAGLTLGKRSSNDTETTAARCVVCGFHWQRPAGMAWASRCPECFRWARAYSGIRAAARALRGEVPRA